MAWWPRIWFEKRGSEIEAYDKEVVRFWCEFIEAFADLVSEDGCVDFNNPECIDAYVGPPFALLKLNAQKAEISVSCGTQEFPPKSFYEDRILKIRTNQGDLNEWGVAQLMPPRDCGVFIAKSLFELRKQGR